MRQALGTAVFFGMLGVTGFGLFLTPIFYIVIMWLKGSGPAGQVSGATSETDKTPPPVPSEVVVSAAPTTPEQGSI